MVAIQSLVRRVWTYPPVLDFILSRAEFPFTFIAMPHAPTNTVDSDIATFSRVPPPPYPGSENVDAGQYDLTPIPQNQNRPRLPEEKRNPHLMNCESYMFLLYSLT